MATQDAGMNRMRNLLANYYGTNAIDEETKKKQAKDIDSSAFEADTYCRELLKDTKTKQLLAKNAELVGEVKHLDSDMQMLVYENYNKFIKATDTIRSMKTKVDEMATQTEAIVKNVESIQSISENIKKSLAGPRDKTEQLVRVRRLLSKLEFLFELPMRLNRSIELEAYAQAVKYYTTATSVLLAENSGIPSSFKHIAEEANIIINKLKITLKKLIVEDNISASKLAEYVGLLLQLKEPRGSLRVDFLAKHKSRLEERLHRFTPGHVDPLYEALDIQGFVLKLNELFLEECVEVCRVYGELFIAPAANSTETKEATSALTDVTKSLFVVYLNILKARFMNEKKYLAGSLNELENLASKDDGGGFMKFSTALKDLVQTGRSVKNQVHYPRLGDKISEVVEGGIRHQVDLAFVALKAGVSGRLLALQNELATASSSLSSESKGEETSKDNLLPNVARKTSALVQDDIKLALKGIQPLVKVATSLLSDMSKIFVSLVQGHLQSFLLWFNNVLESQADPYHSSRNNGEILNIVAPLANSSLSPLHAANNPPSSPKDLNPRAALSRRISVTHFPELVLSPKFVLCLALVCRDMELNGIPHILGVLIECLPADDTATTSRSKTDTSSNQYGSMVDIPDLIKRTSATSQKLLCAYVDLNGNKLATMLRKGCETPDWLTMNEPRDVRAVILLIIEELLTTTKLLAEAFGGPVLLEPGTTLSGTRGGARQAAGGVNRKPKGALQLDIERIFAKKLQIFGGVDFNRETIFSAILKSAFKTYCECVRLCTFGKNGFQQIQVDTLFLRDYVGYFLADPSVHEILLDDVIQVTSERCIDPTPMENSIIQALLKNKKQNFNSTNSFFPVKKEKAVEEKTSISPKIMRVGNKLVAKYKSISPDINIKNAREKSEKKIDTKKNLIEDCELNLLLLEARGLIRVYSSGNGRNGMSSINKAMQWTRFVKFACETILMSSPWRRDITRFRCLSCSGEIFCTACSSFEQVVYERKGNLKVPLEDGKEVRICAGCNEKSLKARSIVQYCMSPGMYGMLENENDNFDEHDIDMPSFNL